MGAPQEARSMLCAAKTAIVRRSSTGGSQLRRMTTNPKSKEKTAELVMRMRRSEEETKKYGAPLGQAILVGAAGLTAIGLGMWGWTNMDTRMGSIRSRGGF
ncbi:hypothetical protein T484DRAFT_1883467 [Baffinella frigidus]|nr:hypothetical protein T484DRAFT_1883467 [Cryptophyta sp. CCMP2293]|mmetsp:Transcript_53623/g.127504  ORF Transcript_53623/g.127504 Transcript_53623/m.127504 type:complete len:101 (+) Transcript_53623:41-343(+)